MYVYIYIIYILVAHSITGTYMIREDEVCFCLNGLFQHLFRQIICTLCVSGEFDTAVDRPMYPIMRSRRQD